MNIADVLNKKISALKSPIVVGLDPILSGIPDVYKEPYKNLSDPFEGVARTFLAFNCDMI